MNSGTASLHLPGNRADVFLTQRALQDYPLPEAFAERVTDGPQGLLEMYREAARGRSCGHLWAGWLLLNEARGVSAGAAAASLGASDLTALTRWARRTSHPDYPAIYLACLEDERARGEYPLDQDTLHYLDLFLEAGKPQEVCDFFAEDFAFAATHPRCIERSRLVLALAKLCRFEEADSEYAVLARGTGKANGDVLAVKACLLAARGLHEDAATVARNARKQCVADEVLDARLTAMLGAPSKPSNPALPPLSTVEDAFQNTVHDIVAGGGTFVDRLERLRAGFDAVIYAEPGDDGCAEHEGGTECVECRGAKPEQFGEPKTPVEMFKALTQSPGIYASHLSNAAWPVEAIRLGTFESPNHKWVAADFEDLEHAGLAAPNFPQVTALVDLFVAVKPNGDRRALCATLRWSTELPATLEPVSFADNEHARGGCAVAIAAHTLWSELRSGGARSVMDQVKEALGENYVHTLAWALVSSDLGSILVVEPGLGAVQRRAYCVKDAKGQITQVVIDLADVLQSDTLPSAQPAR